MKLRWFSILLLSAMTACSSGAERLSIRDAWARPAIESMNSAAYFIIENPGDEDRLVNATSTIAESTEIHRSFMDVEGIMHMERQDTVSIPASSQIRFEPGGFHVMFVSLNQDLVSGQQIQIRLQFENQGEVVIDVPIQTP